MSSLYLYLFNKPKQCILTLYFFCLYLSTISAQCVSLFFTFCSRKLRALYLRRKLEEATAEQKEASRHGSKEVSLLHRQLAELVQHNKGLSERNRELRGLLKHTFLFFKNWCF